MAKKESYEEMLEKLQGILNSIEEDDLNLDESMKAYEEGVKLVNKLYKTLNTLEGKVTLISGEKEVELDKKNEDRES